MLLHANLKETENMDRVSIELWKHDFKPICERIKRIIKLFGLFSKDVYKQDVYKIQGMIWLVTSST